MELVERDSFLQILQTQFDNVLAGEGHSLFVSGEAGIGKTSLVKAFSKSLNNKYKIYHGTCDALFTPRPLAPLYDILLQIGIDIPESGDIKIDRSALFSKFFNALLNQKEACLIIFEDIHWADEATLDFIKFLSRRIKQIKCLFILTYRDNEVHSRHPLRNVLGQLDTDSFTRVQLQRLSREAVDAMAKKKGYNGEDVYKISEGNPFYVNEILASYSPGIPDNIKDSILAVFNRHEAKTRQVWELLSVLPTGFDLKHIEKADTLFSEQLSACVEAMIIFLEDGRLFFKHELYRRTIEASLSPLLRVELNKKILLLFRESFEKQNELERIVHHAKNANDYDCVVKYAPIAGRQAASVGAHTEAARLYLTAIEYYQGNDPNILIPFYETYAYECYLTNQVHEAIIYETRALALLKKEGDEEKTGNAMRFLSRLWWYSGNGKQADHFAAEAIETLVHQPSSKVKAMAYSNMSQLKMLADDSVKCLVWGEKAIEIANEINDKEALSHALNNVGAVQMRVKETLEKGKALLQQSLSIALENGYHEHAARAYTNLAFSSVTLHDTVFAREILNKGIEYCQERDLDSWLSYMLGLRAELDLETGHWNDAYDTASNLLSNEHQPTVNKIIAWIVAGTIAMRRGETNALPLLLEAKQKAIESKELQRIIPAFAALLEHEWLTGVVNISKDEMELATSMMQKLENVFDNNELVFWLRKTRKESFPLKQIDPAYQIDTIAHAHHAANIWETAGIAYRQGLALFEGSEDDKKRALTIMQSLGAQAVYERMKGEMRESGIKSIPRGIRKTTQANPALLTGRELDVIKLLHEGLQNKEIASRLFISAKTVDHHISSILFKLEVTTRGKAVQAATKLGIIK